MEYPENTKVNPGGTVEVTLSWTAGKSKVIFTGTVNRLYKRDRSFYFSACSSNSLLDTPLAPVGWDNVLAGDIILDLLSQCGIGKHNLDCVPGIKLKRYSHGNITGRELLLKLIHTLEKSYGLTDIIFFFDAQDVFHFGNQTELQIEEERIDIKTGFNLIRCDKNNYETFALPIQYNQVVYVNDERRICIESCYNINPGKNRVEIKVEPI